MFLGYPFIYSLPVKWTAASKELLPRKRKFHLFFTFFPLFICILTFFGSLIGLYMIFDKQSFCIEVLTQNNAVVRKPVANIVFDYCQYQAKTRSEGVGLFRVWILYILPIVALLIGTIYHQFFIKHKEAITGENALFGFYEFIQKGNIAR